MKNNKKKRQRQRILIILFLIICIFLVFILFRNNKEFYKVEDRTTNIKEEKKKDNNKVTTIGWIRVQGTNIDAPIVAYSKDYDFYEDSVGKSNFAYNIETTEKIYNKVNIMGHNILNLSKNPRIKDKRFSRFDNLMAFVYIDFAKKNKYIQYTIDGDNYLYKIYAVRLYSSYDKVETEIKKRYTESAIEKYVKEIKKDSIYDYDVKIDGKDNLISLITCSRFYGEDTDSSFVVDARMVRKGEPIKNYTVQETDNYKKILKIMKGDGKNEV